MVESLPLTDTITPSTQADVAAAVRAAHDAVQPIYPLGGRTTLDYGVAPTRPGLGLDLTSLSRVVDYTPRDMTVLVEAGIRLADLATLLAAEGQHLPIDVPRAGEATVGGVVATNWTGPRRYGHGTIRDYVIGIHAVDGRGIAFKGGGRVVKNVAGYDFCKLLCGSLGTLGVITQLALKLKPLPEQSATITAVCPDLATADKILNRFVSLPAPPVAIDLSCGRGPQFDRSTYEEMLKRSIGASRSIILDEFVHAAIDAIAPISSDSKWSEFQSLLIVRVEGTEAECNWLADAVQYEMWQGGGLNVGRLDAVIADRLWQFQVEFPEPGPHESPVDSPLVLKISVPPSRECAMIAELLAVDPNCTIQAHAASGILIARFAEFTSADLTKVLVGRLRPLAIHHGGSLVVLSTTLAGLTPHILWGNRTAATALAARIKQKFDPHNILNPDRFAYH